ncbi:hypothetical protein R9X47_24360 [Wukongibacter baidiensis]|uniref:hypothetical protein n=1 Tax=Wukongibacter baidiensis TaxID=1723361 RepID=UPI003D7F1CD0
MSSNKNNNEFEKEMEQLNEWQNNQYNPGHYIGTGRTPTTVSGLARYPIFLLVIGLFFEVPTILFMVLYRTFDMFFLAPLILGLCFIYGGVQRIRMNRK